MTAVPFFSRPSTRALVIGSFFFLTLPTCAYLTFVARTHASDSVIDIPVPMQFYFVGIGITHFVLTFAVYLSAANRQHFVSSGRNVVRFWVLPLVPFLFLATWYGLALDAEFVLATTIISIGIRALDFQHVNRQAFGVLQLMKGPARAQLPKWSVRTENAHFMGLAALLLLSFLNEKTIKFDSWVTWVAIGWTGVFFTATVVAYAIALKAGADRRHLAASFAYTCVQTVAMMLAIYQLAYYACALAIHYVEYHLVMGRRVLRGAPGEKDSVWRALKRSPALLYIGLIIMSWTWLAIVRSQGAYVDAPIAKRTLVHIFDGLFVFHYVIEMSIWKFSEPYFRKSIAPLYA